jgi:hypothetical protein
MRRLFDLLNSIVQATRKIDVKQLPTQGYFYPKDFEIKIKKAKIEDIISYEYNYNAENVLEVVDIIKKFVKNNLIFSNGYTFWDLKSIDIIFIFIEIVRFTNNRPVKISYFDSNSKKLNHIDFLPNMFNYFDFKPFKGDYNKDLLSFEVDGYRFSMPSVGVENSITGFLLTKVREPEASYYNKQTYDFMFFLGTKNTLTDDEICNLITIFNYDLDDKEKNKIKKIISKFQPLIGYTIRVDDKIIDLKSNLDLANIWKE